MGMIIFAEHPRPSSAWLNVMDGEEMAMSAALPVLPDSSHSMITVTPSNWAQTELRYLSQSQCWFLTTPTTLSVPLSHGGVISQ